MDGHHHEGLGETTVELGYAGSLNAQLHSHQLGNKFASVGFGEKEYGQILKETLKMEDLVAKHSAIMDKYDPQKKIALVVDEWGSWYAPSPGSNPGSLFSRTAFATRSLLR
jgi:alpha-N-arabinofuranosidase